jgi:hypothetical protein
MKPKLVDGVSLTMAIRDATWQDVNRLPEKIWADLTARGFVCKLEAVRSTHSFFLQNLNYLHIAGVYTAPILLERLSTKTVRGKWKADAKAIRMAENVVAQAA